MLYKLGTKFEEWLLPRGRTLLIGLLAANLVLAVALVVSYEPEPALRVAAAQPSLDVDQEIQLLKEVPDIEPAVEKPARECRVWGPAPSPDDFTALIAQLEASGSFPEVQERKVKAASDYLVYLDQLGSRENAKRVVQELTALDIESYLIDRKDRPLMLSVGVFSRQALAEKQQRRLTELGYTVAIEELTRSQTVYQLSAHVEADSEARKSSTSSCIEIAHNTEFL